MFFSLSTQLYVFSPSSPKKNKNKKARNKHKENPQKQKSKQMGINLIGTPLQKNKNAKTKQTSTKMSLSLFHVVQLLLRMELALECDKPNDIPLEKRTFEKKKHLETSYYRSFLNIYIYERNPDGVT